VGRGDCWELGCAAIGAPVVTTAGTRSARGVLAVLVIGPSFYCVVCEVLNVQVAECLDLVELLQLAADMSAKHPRIMTLFFSVPPSYLCSISNNNLIYLIMCRTMLVWDEEAIHCVMVNRLE